MTEAVRPSAKADVVDPTRFQTYQRGHPVLFRIVLSLIVGLVLEIALATLPFPPLKFVRQSADETLDVMTRLAALMKTEPVSDLRFAFVNIDEKSWLAWKTPLITPRDMIATLLPVWQSQSPR